MITDRGGTARRPFLERMTMRTNRTYHNPLPVPSVIELRSVDSTMFDEIGYDGLTKTCAVRFLSGDLYHVYPVAPETFAAFDRAPSKGRFYNEVFKDSPCYSVAKIVQQAEAGPPASSALEIDGLFIRYAEARATLEAARVEHDGLRDRIIDQMQSR
jgi:hypothetical protein